MDRDEEVPVIGYPPRFDELYVVSDIHMGGDPGFQIFNRGLRLGAFIRHVADQRPGDDVGAVQYACVERHLGQHGEPEAIVDHLH